MFRNYLMTAVRNLMRNWLYASISILGLAVAFAGAILIAQFVRNEFTYDRWIPDYQHIYKITTDFRASDQPDSNSDLTQGQVLNQLRSLTYPNAVAMARTAAGPRRPFTRGRAMTGSSIRPSPGPTRTFSRSCSYRPWRAT